ncbi:hypothetical protein B0H10DRAFT_1787559, partial [Mycena sp. CBHHK59/15]
MSGFDIQHHIIRDTDSAPESPAAVLVRIIRETGIAGNAEQERAIRTVGEHFIKGTQEQLLMYIAGVGGSGKSFVVKALVEFFKCCGCREALMLSVPTGCSAVIIDGFTIHALTFLPKS